MKAVRGLARYPEFSPELNEYDCICAFTVEGRRVEVSNELWTPFSRATCGIGDIYEALEANARNPNWRHDLDRMFHSIRVLCQRTLKIGESIDRNVK